MSLKQLFFLSKFHPAVEPGKDSIVTRSFTSPPSKIYYACAQQNMWRRVTRLEIKFKCHDGKKRVLLWYDARGTTYLKSYDCVEQSQFCSNSKQFPPCLIAKPYDDANADASRRFVSCSSGLTLRIIFWCIHVTRKHWLSLYCISSFANWAPVFYLTISTF